MLLILMQHIARRARLGISRYMLYNIQNYFPVSNIFRNFMLRKMKLNLTFTTMITKEQFLKGKTHKVVRISDKRILYSDYQGTEAECCNLINARMRGAWAIIALTEDERERLWGVYNNKYNY